MINKFFSYTVLSYNKTVNTVLLLYDVICCLKIPSAKYSINLFQQIPLDIIPKWFFWNQEYSSDISLQKLEYIVKSSLYKNLDTELDINTNFIGKFCDNKLCQKKLAQYDSWYCYDGYAYCCPNCRLKFIENVSIKEHMDNEFM
jgi:hypothetical protein